MLWMQMPQCYGSKGYCYESGSKGYRDYKKYQTEVQKFGAEQIGRRRRDDYTDGEPRIPVPQQTP